MNYERTYKHPGHLPKNVYLKRGDRIDLCSTLDVALNTIGMGSASSSCKKCINGGGIYKPSQHPDVAIWRAENGKDYLERRIAGLA